MTTRELLQSVEIDLRDAEALLAHVLDVDRGWLIAHAGDPVCQLKAREFMKKARARMQGEPLSYLLGYRDFWTLRLIVNPHVLIPRRETEHLVEWALERIDRSAQRVLDLGTGSGAVALACKSARPEIEMCGTDISEDALRCARLNAEQLALDVDWRCGRWFESVRGERWDLVVSNPPYIAEADAHLSEGDLPAEPRTALVGGATGLEALQEIICLTPNALSPGGWLLLEHGYDQAESVAGMLRNAGFSDVSTRSDWSGQPRITGGQWAS